MAKPGPDPLDACVGARIRLRRKALGISQSELADALALTFQQVQKYEKGANRVSASILVKIAKRLDCTVAFLVGEEGDATNLIVPTTLVTPGAVELLEIYASIGSRRSRSALLAVAKALAARETDAEAASEAA